MRAQFEIKLVTVSLWLLSLLSFTTRPHHREKCNHADIRAAPVFSFKLKMWLGEAYFAQNTCARRSWLLSALLHLIRHDSAVSWREHAQPQKLGGELENQLVAAQRNKLVRVM